MTKRTVLARAAAVVSSIALLAAYVLYQGACGADEGAQHQAPAMGSRTHEPSAGPLPTAVDESRPPTNGSEQGGHFPAIPSSKSAAVFDEDDVVSSNPAAPLETAVMPEPAPENPR